MPAGTFRVRAWARTRTHKCPECLSWMIARSSLKSLVERLVSKLVAWRPYRCLRCGARFFDRSISVA